MNKSFPGLLEYYVLTYAKKEAGMSGETLVGFKGDGKIRLTAVFVQKSVYDLAEQLFILSGTPDGQGNGLRAGGWNLFCGIQIPLPASGQR